MSTFNVSSLLLTTMLCHHLIVICSGSITFEEYEELGGERFCSTRERPALIKICNRIAVLNSIEDYQQDYLIADCWGTRIDLKKEDESEAPRRDENLLHCRYDGVGRWNDTAGAYTDGPHEQRAVGRGKNQSDVMEYTYGTGGKAVPYMNRENLLNMI